MQISMLKKLSLCAFASILVFWAISKFGDYLFSSNSLEKGVLPNSESNDSNSIGKRRIETKKSNVIQDKKGRNVSGAIALLNTANEKTGKMIFKKCKSCHTTQKGGKNKLGPNLWDIVGRTKALDTNYRFSKAFRKLEGKWDYQDLDKFITKPKEFIKNTKMSFAGIKNKQDRADLILYLRSLSNNPKPLP
ncbi:MAG: cytochrome c family protein [Pseudomonadota bacterium]|nr:cytochrome c family protein [Pseudomonadota bacterium]